MLFQRQAVSINPQVLAALNAGQAASAAILLTALRATNHKNVTTQTPLPKLLEIFNEFVKKKIDDLKLALDLQTKLVKEMTKTFKGTDQLMQLKLGVCLKKKLERFYPVFFLL